MRRVRTPSSFMQHHPPSLLHRTERNARTTAAGRCVGRLLCILGPCLLSGCTSAPHTSPGSQSSALPTESQLSAGVVRQWAERLMSADPAARGAAEQSLIDGGAESLPLLRRFLRTDDEDLHASTFDIVHQLGPDAIGLLTDLLRDPRDSIRLAAVGLLIDLAPDTKSVQSEIAAALADREPYVAADAARALGALGDKAAPSVPALAAALSHQNSHVRSYSAEALASVGPAAAGATDRLAITLRDPVPAVRWATCQALASIGPAAAATAPQLVQALNDDFLYVRICAAGALGSMGDKAAAAVEPLRQAARDPTMREEAEWALSRITGIEPNAATNANLPDVALAPEPPLATTEGDPPADWDIETKRNIVWSVPLGGEAFGRPVVAGGGVYVGSDNRLKRNPALDVDCGVLLAFRESDGEFLWQDVAPPVKQRGLRGFLLPSTTSAPYVDGNRLYYMTAECQLRCLDTNGFRDGENNGPFQNEPFKDRQSSDIIWELDVCARLGVFVHEAANSEVLPIGDLLLVCTSNGRNEGHTRVPSPRAPSLIAVDKRTGDVVWRAIGAGEHVLHGQWCSPVAATVNGRMQVLFGGGDGWLRGYDAATGREIWRFDGNPKDARWLPRPGVLSRSGIVAAPVLSGGRVFVAMGEDPSHGNGPSLVHALSPNGQGDVTESRRLWTSRDVGRVVGTPIVSDGLLYVADLGGTVHCLDAATGAQLWKHDTNAEIWGCLLLAAGRLYAGNMDGYMTVLKAGRKKQVLTEIEMDAALYSRPAVVGDSMYVATADRLYRIEVRRDRP